MRFIRKPGTPSERSPKRLHAEPAELARKLVKEMDDHVIVGGDQDWVRNRYTVYLCPEDYENLAPRAPQLVADLRAKLAKHVADMEYLVQGELMVELVLDEERVIASVENDDERHGARAGRRESDRGRDVDDPERFPPHQGDTAPPDRGARQRRDPARAGRLADPVERHGEPFPPGAKREEVARGHEALPASAHA